MTEQQTCRLRLHEKMSQPVGIAAPSLELNPWMEFSLADEFAWTSGCKEKLLPAIVSFFPLGAQFSPLVGLPIVFEPYVVDHDPPFDPAKAIIMSAWKLTIYDEVGSR